MNDPLQRLAPIVHDIIAPTALARDAQAAFPREAVAAMGRAGLLGLTTATEAGGMGLGLPEACSVVETIAQACASTAMVVAMHYSANTVLEAHAPLALRQDVARGAHLSTLAFSEVGSRSHFWAPVGTATAHGADVAIHSQKSWVTSAGEAASYIWSSRPLAAEGASSLWLMPQGAPGLSVSGGFDGLGLRANASAPMRADGVVLPKSALLGADGEGFNSMMTLVLPTFIALNASCSLGLMLTALNSAVEHVTKKRFEHLGSTLADLPTVRAQLARAHVAAMQGRAMRDEALAALAAGRPDAMLKVLELKATTADAALFVTDVAMRVCGGAAFRKEAGIEMPFRDARAAHVMAPTSDALYDFIGKAVCGQPLF